jgi:hypothetical protein
VRIDGHLPQELDGCWQNSRVSTLPTVPDWPGLTDVGVRPSLHRADRWRLRIAEPAGEGAASFTLFDGAGGQGTGTTDRPFTSRDGTVTIAPAAWMLPAAHAATGHAVPAGTVLGWDRHFACADAPPVPLAPGAIEQRHLVATGLPNTSHTVMLTLARDAPAVREVRVYRPYPG